MLDVKFYVLLEAIATHGSVHDGASAIGITQPAATHRIREMERRLGISLFSREGRRLILTASGERLLQAAHEILPKLRLAELEAWQLARRAKPALRLGVGPYDTFNQVVTALYDQLERDIDVVRLPMGEMSTALLSGKVDMLIMIEVPMQRGLAHIPLFIEPLMAVLPLSHPYAKAASVPPQVFDEGRHFTYDVAPQANHEFELFFQPAEIYPSQMIQVESVSLILDLVAANKGISILSRWAAQEAEQAGKVALVPLDANIPPIPWHLAHADEPHITEAAHTIARSLRQHYAIS